MPIISAHLPRFRPMAPWANRILRVDLSEMTIRVQEAEPYIPDYLGGRGFAARLAWDEYPRPAPPFDPANPLMVFAGALTGSRAPYSGRATVCGFSPQAWPHQWFTRSSIGKHFGGELKRAGYDGLVVTGAAERPVQIAIRDDEVSILPADDLWGLDALDTLEALGAGEDGQVRALAIGPAGEHLSRIATIQTASSSAAGQGGFGAVMGSKKLKAISVRGSGVVPLAQPERMTALSRAMAAQLKRTRMDPGRVAEINASLAAERGGRLRLVACTEGCPTPCVDHFSDMPGVAHERQWSGDMTCIGAAFPEFAPREALQGMMPDWQRWDWHLGRYGGFEMNVLANRYGLNQADLLVGMVPWLIACQQAGLISSLEGRVMDWCDAGWWDHLLRLIAYRQGVGDALAEGGWRAALTLDLGRDIAAARYPGWGCAGHWDGHTWGLATFPYWLTPVLQWIPATRDLVTSGFASMRAMRTCGSVFSAQSPEERDAAIGRARRLSQRLYGSPEALDPYSGYAGKAEAAFFNTVHPALLDSIPLDVVMFPLLWDPVRFDLRGERPGEDGVRWLYGVDGEGDVDGLSVEERIWEAGTGLGWDRPTLNWAGVRILALERALQARLWGRDRTMDETILPYYERPELVANPLLGQRYGLDRAQFAPVIDEFYTLHGWDARGWPRRESLEGLGLGEVYEPMVEGAALTPLSYRPWGEARIGLKSNADKPSTLKRTKLH